MNVQVENEIELEDARQRFPTGMEEGMVAPFPWFGGKRRVAGLVWDRFGDVPNYVEPFAGSLAVLLARPHRPRAETVNDLDCYLANFWRCFSAIRKEEETLAGEVNSSSSPPAPLLRGEGRIFEEVAEFANWPVNEADLHARHSWLVNQGEFRERMKRDPFYFDARIAGWWVWGLSQWIGGGWCQVRVQSSKFKVQGAEDVNGVGGGDKEMLPWQTRPAMITMGTHKIGDGTWRKRPNLRRGGKGVEGVSMAKDRVEMKRPLLNGRMPGVNKNSLFNNEEHLTPSLSPSEADAEREKNGGIRTKRQMPDCSGNSGAYGRGVHRCGLDGLMEYFSELERRLRRVRVCCGDWKRVLGPSPTFKIGMTGILLDPPYGLAAGRDKDIYAQDSLSVADRVREWAIANGENRLLRIALCGYEGEHEMPSNWAKVAWRANGGYANSFKVAGKKNDNAGKERVWFSPWCREAGGQKELF